MITFRLSAREYEQCRELCYNRGIKSVSGMARAAINLLLQQPHQAETQTLETRVADLEGRLHYLLMEMKRVRPLSAPQGQSVRQSDQSSLSPVPEYPNRNE